MLKNSKSETEGKKNVLVIIDSIYSTPHLKFSNIVVKLHINFIFVSFNELTHTKGKCIFFNWYVFKERRTKKKSTVYINNYQKHLFRYVTLY